MPSKCQCQNSSGQTWSDWSWKKPEGIHLKGKPRLRSHAAEWHRWQVFGLPVYDALIPCSLHCPPSSYNIYALHCDYLWASYHSPQTVRSWRVRNLLLQQLVVWVSACHLLMVLQTFIIIRKKKEDFMKINHSFLFFSEKLLNWNPSPQIMEHTYRGVICCRKQ